MQRKKFTFGTILAAIGLIFFSVNQFTASASSQNYITSTFNWVAGAGLIFILIGALLMFDFKIIGKK